MNTEDILSGFQEFFPQPIIKDRSNNMLIAYVDYPEISSHNTNEVIKEQTQCRATLT